MDPGLVSIVAQELSAPALTGIARVMSKWLQRLTDQSVRLKVAGEHGIEVADLTPANIEVLLKEIGERPTGSLTPAAGDALARAFTPRPREAAPVPEAMSVTERPDPASLKVSLLQETLVRMHDRLVVELPHARARERLVKRVRLSGSLAALVSNVGVLGALGFGNTAASIIAAVIALLVSGLKTVEDHLIAGVTGKEPDRLQAMVIESTRLSYEVEETLNSFNQLNIAHASPQEYPLMDANRIAKDLLRLLPEMEVVHNS